jgi:hypothetical protein
MLQLPTVVLQCCTILVYSEVNKSSLPPLHYTVLKLCSCFGAVATVTSWLLTSTTDRSGWVCTASMFPQAGVENTARMLDESISAACLILGITGRADAMSSWSQPKNNPCDSAVLH